MPPSHWIPNPCKVLVSHFFLDHYSYYCYTHLMRETSAQDSLHAKESYKCLAVTHGTRVCAYRSHNERFSDTPFKEAIRSCGQQISFCGVRSYHQNEIVESRIKELTLFSRSLLLHATRLCPEYISTMLWNFSFRKTYQRYNSLEINEEVRTPKQNFSMRNSKVSHQTTTPGISEW